MEGFSDETPIVVILPGLAGCACTDYVSHVVKTINDSKYR